MAGIVWSEPALADLESIADWVALYNPSAAAALVRSVFGHVGQLADHPDSGVRIPELRDTIYRQIVEPPCRILYRRDGSRVLIVHVMRSERQLRREWLEGGP